MLQQRLSQTSHCVHPCSAAKERTSYQAAIVRARTCRGRMQPRMKMPEASGIESVPMSSVGGDECGQCGL